MKTAVQPSASARRIRIVLGAIVLLILLGGERIWLAAHREVIAKDGIHYVMMARRVAENGLAKTISEMPWLHPGYSTVTAVVHGAMGGQDRESWERAGTLVAFNASLVAMLGVWALATKLIGSPQIGWVAALLFGLGHKVAVLGADVGNDAMALAFAVWSLVAFLHAADVLAANRARAWLWAALGGLLSGLAYLTRPESAIVVPVALALWLAMVVRGRAKRAPAAACMGVSLAGWALCAVPYMVAVGSLLGKWGGGYFDVADAGGGWPVAMLLATGRGVAPAFGDVIAEFFEAQHPALGAMTCMYVVAWLLGRREALAPWRDTLPRPNRRGALVMVTLVILSLPVLTWRETVAEGSSRYLVLMAAVLAVLPAALLAAAGLLAASLVDMRQARKRVFWGATIALAVTLGAHALRPMHSGDVYLRDAGLQLKAAAGADDVILSNSAYVLYYSEADTLYRRDESTGTLAATRFQPDKIARKRLATFVALKGEAASASLQADSEAMQRGGYRLWQEIERHPGKTGGRLLRIWRAEP
ncbi:MAG: phospholipid carrier-dependent glycosyltransferase [Planctomycetes bacterium]|jgi:hypothetical protein|nr:glycosyltransferase family 39 protein [Phycisphaerae bacterium]NBB95555.1 phospholipid carrier-dependent glycosyltransferase [Planctomycetota bacterium]